MTIKNFTVITQRVKNKQQGYLEYTNYLVNQKSKSHKNTEIINLSKIDVNEKSIKTIANTLKFDANNKKGGRKVESYGQSFVFSLPVGVTPTLEQWKKISTDISKSLFEVVFTKDLELNDEQYKVFTKDLYNLMHRVVHNQKNAHLNIVIPRIAELNGELVRLDNIDKKSFLNKAKEAFNLAVLKHLELDFKKYEPSQENTGKSLKQWQKRQKQADEALAQAALEMKKAAEMQQQAEEKALQIEKKAKEERNKTLVLIEKEKRNFEKFKFGFFNLLDLIKFYTTIEFRKEKIEKNKEIQEQYKIVSSNENFDESSEKILNDYIDIADEQLDDDDELKLRPKLIKYT